VVKRLGLLSERPFLDGGTVSLTSVRPCGEKGYKKDIQKKEGPRNWVSRCSVAALFVPAFNASGPGEGGEEGVKQSWGRRRYANRYSARKHGRILRLAAMMSWIISFWTRGWLKEE